MATQEQEILVSTGNRQPSDRLKSAISNCALGFKKLADAINDTIAIGAEEGFSSKEVGIMIRQEMIDNGFSDRTVRKYLPAEAKMQSKQRFAAQNSANIGLTVLPQDYSTENLEKYTKQFLIEIIRYLEGKFKVSLNSPEEKPLNRKKFEIVSNSPQERQVLELHNHGKSVREIAAIVGKSVSATQRIITKNKRAALLGGRRSITN